MDFGKVLRRLRRDKGISIKQLASDLDVNYTYISKIENSHVTPSSTIVNKISSYFNYSSDELLLISGKLPKDIEDILRNNPEEAVRLLRSKFAGKHRSE